MPKFKFDTTPMNEILKSYAQARKEDIPTIVRSNARLMCVELARRTQPFGNSARVEETGVGRTKNDIGKVIKTEQDVSEMFEFVSHPKIKSRLQALAQANRWDVVEIVMRNIGFLNKWGDMQFVTDLGPIHQRNRNARTGRTPSRADRLYIANSATLETYADEVAARVGLSKGGWADAARELRVKRPTRGIPTWVAKHKKGNGSASDNTGNLAEPTVSLTNSTPWVDRICPATEQIKAGQVVIAKAKKQIAKILDYEARKSGAAKSALTE